ncbi:hypothetical protein KP77_09000 [Jeotgalibacillus alimentarius]|uniref:N-acetyltransferase n=1 Tax=Jeotgalibacillus alimentarius TaxID=135826 RepID=A0A0C2W5S3_9BACL|nr:arylamine N-acetyltransferase [Jeotgalibacillus alimentarius]KIL51388.1 hypothetical protein KP77_09000 [Jeotgalibacillus alimentarius]
MFSERFLAFLDLEKEAPSLHYLNRLVEAHQRKVRWETMTKFIDYAERNEEDAYLPTAEECLDRIIHKGAGGTCYTLARGFHKLLAELGFEVHYLFMNPRHLCLRVDLEGEPYYVDTGYSAPLFQAYPLRKSFEVKAPAETFTYSVSDREITVTREPGPVKQLITEPVSWEWVKEHVRGTHDWQDGFAFQSLKLFGYIDGVAVSLRDNGLRIFRETGFEDHILDQSGVMEWVRRFGFDEGTYQQAVDIYTEKKGKAPY